MPRLVRSASRTSGAAISQSVPRAATKNAKPYSSTMIAAAPPPRSRNGRASPTVCAVAEVPKPMIRATLSTSRSNSDGSTTAVKPRPAATTPPVARGYSARSMSRRSHCRVSHASAAVPAATPSGNTTWRNDSVVTVNPNASIRTSASRPATVAATTPTNATGSGVRSLYVAAAWWTSRKLPRMPIRSTPGGHAHMYRPATRPASAAYAPGGRRASRSRSTTSSQTGWWRRATSTATTTASTPAVWKNTSAA